MALLSDLGFRDFDELASSAGMSRSERVRILAPSTSCRRLVVARAPSSGDEAVPSCTPRRFVDRLLADRRVVRSGLSAIREHDVDLTVQKGFAEVYVDQRLASDLAHDYLLRSDVSRFADRSLGGH